MRLFGFAMMFCLVSLTWAARPATVKKAPAKKSTAAATAGKKTTGKTTAKSASAKKGSGKKAPAKKATWRNRQMAPTPTRYREIQEALAAKGYLSPADATGAWTQSSVDALKRFQAAQNIESSGKINSLSLIALGLGPKREAIVKPPAPAPADQ